ncbi:BPSL0761 family protein [Paraburkholderia tropica]|uniref:BPSL0761 family protein n=1 Tax=Paraburkholderia tropica TaxID=92647 RepID=UPI002ABD2FE2|nr:BPSL0761 family protein [Paraburkholderia tropica]
MTTPNERTKAVLDTRVLLQMLAGAEVITIGGLIQTVALGLLKHYPRDADLHESAAALPDVWARPVWRIASSVSAPVCERSILDVSNERAVHGDGENDGRSA